MPNGNNNLREFDRFCIDLEKKVLWHNGEPVQLPSKAVNLLCALVERGGDVVTKDEILENVWHDSFVEESVIPQNIHHLRKTLKEHGLSSDLIQTVPLRGYRFSADIQTIGDDEDEVIFEREIVERSLFAEIDEDSDLIHPETNVNFSQLSSAGTARSKTRRILIGLILLAVIIPAGFVVSRQFGGDRVLSLAPVNERKINSIAVLPLKNLNEKEQNKTLAIGLTDNLISRLGSLNRFAVRPLDAVEDFEQSGRDALDFGQRLQVDAVLVGTMQADNDRIRVNVRLLDVRDGAQIWTSSFDETETDIFTLQDALAIQVSESLTTRLTPEEQQRLAKRNTENKEAYQLYLRGRYFFDERGIENYRKAIAEYEKALALDGNYALAYTGIADAYGLLGNSAEGDKRDAYYELAKQSAERALRLDENLSEAHSSLGWIMRVYKWDWAAAEREFKRAIELNPSNINAHLWYGLLMSSRGRTEEGVRQLKKAKELDPLSVVINIHLGRMLFYDRQYDESLQILRQNLQMDENNLDTRRLIANIYVLQRQYAEALAEIEQIPDTIDFQANLLGMKAVALLGLGESERGRKLLEKTSRRYEGDTTAGYYLAMAFTEFGETDRALELLEQGLEKKDLYVVWVKVHPQFEGLHDMPRFKEMLRKMDLAA